MILKKSFNRASRFIYMLFILTVRPSGAEGGELIKKLQFIHRGGGGSKKETCTERSDRVYKPFNLEFSCKNHKKKSGKSQKG